MQEFSLWKGWPFKSVAEKWIIQHMVLDLYFTPYVRIIPKIKDLNVKTKKKKDSERNHEEALMFWLLNNHRVSKMGPQPRSHKWNDRNIWKFGNIKNSHVVKSLRSKNQRTSQMWCREIHYVHCVSPCSLCSFLYFFFPFCTFENFEPCD